MIMYVIYEYANVLKFITSGARDARTLQKSLLHAYILLWMLERYLNRYLNNNKVKWMAKQFYMQCYLE